MTTNTEDRQLCWRCIGEKFLRAKVPKHGERHTCDYCAKEANAFSIGEVSEDVCGAFERHYTRPPSGPPEHEEFMYRDSDLTWQREGDPSFSQLDRHATRRGRKVIVDAGSDEKLASLYRARVFQSLDKLEESLKRPDVHLGVPLSKLATAGRMNARGIGVFYGATHADVAIAETHPPVGSHVVVGRFDIVRPLRLLDVEALQAILVKGSIFDPTHLERLKKASFLAHLSGQIVLPVISDDEPFEYLVTQAIADYLANLRDPQLDGLLYRSVQQGGSKSNVVPFHKSARVKPLDIPPGTDISAHAMSRDDDGPYPDFWVFEVVPPPRGNDDPSMDFPFLPLTDEDREIRSDRRQPTLVIDVDTITVHHIERASYTSEAFKVRRHGSTRSEGIKRVSRSF